MIHVIASVTVKEGKREQFLEAFKANVPLVKQETGCIEYAPTVDVPADLPPQILDASVVTIIEKWESIECSSGACARAAHAHVQREGQRYRRGDVNQSAPGSLSEGEFRGRERDAV